LFLSEPCKLFFFYMPLFVMQYLKNLVCRWWRKKMFLCRWHVIDQDYGPCHYFSKIRNPFENSNVSTGVKSKWYVGMGFTNSKKNIKPLEMYHPRFGCVLPMLQVIYCSCMTLAYSSHNMILNYSCRSRQEVVRFIFLTFFGDDKQSYISFFLLLTKSFCWKRD